MSSSGHLSGVTSDPSKIESPKLEFYFTKSSSTPIIVAAINMSNKEQSALSVKAMVPINTEILPRKRRILC